MNPPDGFQGVSLSVQSQQLRRNVASARANPRIDMLVWFLIRDEQARKPFAAGFQTGLSFTNGKLKPAWSVFRSLAQYSPAPAVDVPWRLLIASGVVMIVVAGAVGAVLTLLVRRSGVGEDLRVS